MTGMGSIFLVGFMGSGKSTIGSAMAEQIGASFVDLDQLLVERFGTSIEEVFARHGENLFRREETAMLTQVAEQQADAVVATGGGCFCSAVNRGIIASAGGESVFLEVPWPVIERRLPGDNRDRPKFGNADAARELYRQREPLYRMATAAVSLSGDESPADAAQIALDALAEVECVS
jgi:shikimate kinase